MLLRWLKHAHGYRPGDVIAYKDEDAHHYLSRYSENVLEIVELEDDEYERNSTTRRK